MHACACTHTIFTLSIRRQTFPGILKASCFCTPSQVSRHLSMVLASEDCEECCNQKSRQIRPVVSAGQNRAPRPPGTPDKRPGRHLSSSQRPRAARGGAFSVCIALWGPPKICVELCSLQEELCGGRGRPEAPSGSLLSSIL